MNSVGRLIRISGFFVALAPSLPAVAAPGCRPTETDIASMGRPNGVAPIGAPVAIGGELYGATFLGGTSNEGTIYKVEADGTQKTIHEFTGKSDGAHPNPLILGNDHCLYGSTQDSGIAGHFGTIFEVCPSGAFRTLYTFHGTPDGASPAGGVTLGADGMIYGVTTGGGDNNDGMMFALTPSGQLTSLHSFTSQTDGAIPYARPVFGADGALYGMTLFGGVNDGGAIFRVTTSGEFTVLHALDYQFYAYASSSALTPAADGRLYGTLVQAGPYGAGEIFSISTSGDYQLLYTFTAGSDGFSPSGTLVEGRDGNMLGTADGGSYGLGYVFRLRPGGALEPVYSFEGGAMAAMPCSGLLRTPSGTLYGGSCNGGATNEGAFYKLSFIQ